MARILVVDDQERHLDALCANLRDWGHTVLISRNGQDALRTARARSSAIDLIITDIRMPETGIDGVSFVARLREGRIKIPAIFVSAIEGRELDDARRRFEILDLVHFEPKPIDEHHLKVTIKFLLRERSMTAW